jgi:ribosomal protein L37E
VVAVKFEMTKCNQCGSEMLMGADICPSCGQPQSRANRAGSFQPRAMLAVGLAAAVLLFFNWIKAPPPPASQITSPPSASLPSR